MNCVQQIGRLTADPEPLRTTDTGVVTTFRIAVTRAKADTDDADFFTVEVWQRLAHTCAGHLRRGREVAVDGRLSQREWRAEDGTKRERVLIVADHVRFLRGGAGDAAHAAEPGEAIPF
jgi:single-strand DNA-binding protein